MDLFPDDRGRQDEEEGGRVGGGEIPLDSFDSPPREEGHEVFENGQTEQVGEIERNGEEEADKESTTAASTGTSERRRRKRPTRYKSVLWNGKVGTLVLQAEQIVFEGLSGIRVSIPWNLIQNHQWRSSQDGTDGEEEPTQADARLLLLNGDFIDLHFAEQHNLPEIQKAVTQRLQDSQLVSIYAEPNRGIDGKEAVPIIQPANTFTSTGTCTSEQEHEPLLFLRSENSNLRRSVSTLMSQVEELQAQETTYKTRMEQLEAQFERFRIGFLNTTAQLAAGAAHHVGAAHVATANPPPEETSPLRGPPPNVEYQMEDINLDDDDAEKNNGAPGPSVRFAEESTDNDGNSYPLPEAPSNDTLTSNNDGGDDNSDPNRRYSAFTISDSMGTEDGMNLIRRKLPYRRSAVTGRSAYAMNLPPDTYGFMMVAPTISSPYALGILVNGIQITTFFLMAFSIINDGTEYNNPMGIPPNIDTQVRIVQWIAIVIAVVTQDDLMKGLDLIRIIVSTSFYEAFPRTTKTKIISCIFLRCLSGCLGLLASFFLIITSETIYYLLLNFTALEFISQLDEAFFVLCQYGYAGKTCEIAAKAMNETTFYVHTKVYRLRKTLLFFTIAICLLTGWSIIVHKQRHGNYQCKTLLVQFGDDFRPELATFSGLYDQVDPAKSARTNNHLAYVDRQSETAIFAYCDKERYWTFQYQPPGTIGGGTLDACDGWVARSSSTTSYDITITSATNWYVRDDVNREIILDPFVLLCHDCDNYNTCSDRGICSEGVCECNSDFYGLQCEFTAPCHNVSMDSRFPGFIGTRQWSQSFELFILERRIINVYARPMYISILEDNAFDLLFFTGRRWVVSYSNQLSWYSEDQTQEALKRLGDFMEEEFHAHWTSFTAAFLSEPMDVLTPGDAQSPVDMEWYVAEEVKEGQVVIQSPDMIQTIEGRFLCAVCDDALNPCLFGGQCKTNGVCKCTLGAEGALCEKAPLGNGRCDEVVNTALYDLDSGDCCASTCKSKDYRCGRDETGYGYIGYDCRLPTDVWEPRDETGGSVWLTDGGQFGHSVALSEQGNFLAVGAPGLSSVRIYEREGGRWAPRGSPIEGEPDTRFGAHVTISTGSQNRWNNVETKVPLVVGISAPDEANSTIHVFRCDQGGCTQKTRSFDGFDTFDINEAGTMIALGDQERDDGTQPMVHVFDLDKVASPRLGLLGGMDRIIEPVWHRQPIREAGDETTLTYDIDSISLSRDSKTVAIQTAVKDWNIATADLFNCTSCFSFLAYSIEGDGNKSAILRQDSASIYAERRSFVVSSDSNVAAIATPACDKPLAQVYEWNGTVWNHRRPPLPTPQSAECTDDFSLTRMSLSLSSNGGTIALGYAGIVDVFDYNGTRWNRVGKEVQGSFATILGTVSPVSVSLSKDGSFVGFGIPGTSAVQTGIASVASTPPRFPPCNYSSEQFLHFSLTTDENPTSLHWTVFNNETGVFSNQAKPGYYTDVKATYLHELCLPLSSCSILTIYDESTLIGLGDGLRKPGRFDLVISIQEADKKVTRIPVDGGAFSTPTRRVHIGQDCLQCEKGTTMFRMLVYTCEYVGWELVNNVGTNLFQGKNEAPIDKDDLTPYDAFLLENALNNAMDAPNATTTANETEGNATASPTDAPTAAPVGCAKQRHWEELCLPMKKQCFTFYVFLLQRNERLSRLESTRVYLFDNSKQIWEHLVVEEGQTAHSFGNCTG